MSQLYPKMPSHSLSNHVWINQLGPHFPRLNTRLRLNRCYPPIYPLFSSLRDLMQWLHVWQKVHRLLGYIHWLRSIICWWYICRLNGSYGLSRVTTNRLNIGPLNVNVPLVISLRPISLAYWINNGHRAIVDRLFLITIGTIPRTCIARR